MPKSRSSSKDISMFYREKSFPKWSTMRLPNRWRTAYYQSNIATVGALDTTIKEAETKLSQNHTTTQCIYFLNRVWRDTNVGSLGPAYRKAGCRRQQKQPTSVQQAFSWLEAHPKCTIQVISVVPSWYFQCHPSDQMEQDIRNRYPWHNSTKIFKLLE